MNKIDALVKYFGCNPCDIREMDEDGIRFEVEGTTYSLYNDDELEEAARKNIEEVFEDCYTEDGLSDWVKAQGGLSNFYDECFINDFRIEDSEYFGDMTDDEIIDDLEANDYFCAGIPRNALDMEKMVDYVWDIDGATGLSRVDGEINYCEGYNLIKED